MSHPEMISAQSLSYTYPVQEGEVGTAVLHELNLQIEKGKITAVIGHNGSGKSTFAKLCNAIYLPTGGKCYVDGLDTSDESLIFDIRRRAGMVFQNPDNQIISSVVDEDVAFAPENLGVPHEEIVARVDEALEAVNMTAFRHHGPHLLSGGQKQRIAIAGVLAMRPQCVILDEPTAMLDPRGRREVLETVLSMQKRYNLTVVLITHHMNEAAKADRVVVMNEGRVCMDGTPREILTRSRELRAVGLDVPPGVALLDLLHEGGADLPADAFDEETCAERICQWLTSAQRE